MNLSLQSPVRFAGRTELSNKDLQGFKPGDQAVLTTTINLENDVSERAQAITILEILPHEGKTVNGVSVPLVPEAYSSDYVDLVRYKTEDGKEHEMLFGMYTLGTDLMDAIRKGPTSMNKFDENGNPLSVKFTYTRGQVEKNILSVGSYVNAVTEKEKAFKKEIAVLRDLYGKAFDKAETLSGFFQSGLTEAFKKALRLLPPNPVSPVQPTEPTEPTEPE